MPNPFIYSELVSVYSVSQANTSSNRINPTKFGSARVAIRTNPKQIYFMANTSFEIFKNNFGTHFYVNQFSIIQYNCRLLQNPNSLYSPSKGFWEPLDLFVGSQKKSRSSILRSNGQKSSTYSQIFECRRIKIYSKTKVFFFYFTLEVATYRSY